MILFLQAAFYFYSALVQALQKALWRMALIFKTKVVTLRPYPQYSYKMVPMGFVSKLVFTQQPLRHFRRSFEYKVFQFISQNIEKGDILVDVGANVGVLSVFMSQCTGHDGKVYSIEGSSRNAELLKTNLSCNDINNVIVINHAVAEQERWVHMGPPKGIYNDALLVMHDTPQTAGEAIQALPFDTIAHEWSIPKAKLVKIDIEGAELFFFRGARRYLTEYKPILIFETLEVYTKRFDYSVIDVLIEVRNLGYNVTQLDLETWVASPE